jgi:ubiquinol oxidase
MLLVELIAVAMEKLSSQQLREEQAKTLAAPTTKYGVLAKVLFLVMDLLYGRKRSGMKFKVLEIIARVPYQAWEHVAYIAITHYYEQPDFARRIFDLVQEARQDQDNEQWHLLILEEWVHRRGIPEMFFLHRLVPQVIAFAYYQITWLLYLINPSLSYRLNVDFEAHAEREYMRFVAEHPELESEPFESTFKKDYGDFDTMADLFRQIAYDERMHKEQSLAKMSMPRFT